MDIVQFKVTVSFICVFLNFIFILLLWAKGKSKATFHLGLVFLFMSIYNITRIVEFTWISKLFLFRLGWILILALPAFFTFIHYFTDNIKHIKLKILFWYIPSVAIALLAFTTDYFVLTVSSNVIEGPLDPFGRVYFVIVGLPLGLYYLIKGYLSSQGLKRRQLKYVVVVAIVLVGEKVMTLGILPVLSPAYDLIYYIIDDIITVLAIFSTIYMVVFKKMIFEMKIILTEILVGAIALILFVRAFLSQSVASKVLGFTTFFFFLFAGYLLIKTTGKEIKRKEEVEKLAKELEGLNQSLEQKVKERTKDLEKSYQEIKGRKEDLERFYNLAVGRELKMADLKKETEKLKNIKQNEKLD